MTDVEPVAHGKLFQVHGQLIGLRYLGAIQQEWDYGDIALEGRPYFDPHVIVRVIQTARPGVIARIEPVGADHGQQHLAPGNRVRQD